MKSLLTWTERRLLWLFRKLSNRQNFHLKAEMFSFHSKYFVYRELKRAPQKLSFSFKCPDTGTIQILGNILYQFVTLRYVSYTMSKWLKTMKIPQVKTKFKKEWEGSYPVNWFLAILSLHLVLVLFAAANKLPGSSPNLQVFGLLRLRGLQEGLF